MVMKFLINIFSIMVNHHLIELAVSLWKERFSEQEPNGQLGEIIELFDSKRIPLSSKQREKMEKVYPYYGATSLMDYVDDFLFEGTYLLLGEDGTVIDPEGYPILQYIWGKFWVNNHAHVLQGKNGFNVESLYVLLKTTYVSSIVTGAVQLKINQTNLKSIKIFIPPIDEISSFNETIEPIFKKIRNSTDEIASLTELRNSLLTKLMSGEIPVAD
ncbi:restriction endonuclease subunit S [Enterococcus eurekensis]|uniref:Restriction endonuclease subunit S n=1 Tax=Enterococcus eurekensis TaxID=1159753 RepID=A0ABV9M0Y3_9ENTE